MHPAEVYDTLFAGTDILTVDLTAQAKLDVNAEVDTALNTAIPGSPTADSINQRIAAIDDLTQASGAGDLAAILVDTGTTLDGKLNTIDTIVDAIVIDTGTDIPTLVSTVDTVVDAIKAKTDSLTFTVAGQVDANVQSINDTTIIGDGSSGNKFQV